MTILAVVVRDAEKGVAAHALHSVVWLGIEDQPGAPVFDVFQLATEYRSYLQCGRYHSPASVVEVEGIESPFRARVRFQPANSDDVETPGLVWDEPMDPKQLPSDCALEGEIRWVNGAGFQKIIRTAGCQTNALPGYVRIDDSGRITLSLEGDQR